MSVKPEDIAAGQEFWRVVDYGRPLPKQAVIKEVYTDEDGKVVAKAKTTRFYAEDLFYTFEEAVAEATRIAKAKFDATLDWLDAMLKNGPTKGAGNFQKPDTTDPDSDPSV